MDATMKMAAEWVMQVLDKGVDLMAQELPVFVGEVLIYYRVWNTLWAVLCLLPFVLLARGIHNGYRDGWVKDANSAYDLGTPKTPVITTAIGGVLSLVSLIAMTDGGVLSGCLKSWLAPRLFLVEWAGKVLS